MITHATFASGVVTTQQSGMSMYERAVLIALFVVLALALAGVAVILRLRHEQHRAWDMRDTGAPIIVTAPPPLPATGRHPFTLPAPGPASQPAAGQTAPGAATAGESRRPANAAGKLADARAAEPHKRPKHDEVVVRIKH